MPNDIHDSIQQLNIAEQEQYRAHQVVKNQLDIAIQSHYREPLESLESSLFVRIIGASDKPNIVEAYKIARNGPGSHAVSSNSHIKNGWPNKSSTYFHFDIHHEAAGGGCGTILIANKQDIAKDVDEVAAIFDKDAETEELFTRTSTLLPKKKTIIQSYATAAKKMESINALHALKQAPQSVYHYSEVILNIKPHNLAGLFYQQEQSILQILKYREFFRLYGHDLPIYRFKNSNLIRDLELEKLSFIGILLLSLNELLIDSDNEEENTDSETMKARIELIEKTLLSFMGGTNCNALDEKAKIIYLAHSKDEVGLNKIVDHQERDKFFRKIVNELEKCYPIETQSALENITPAIDSARKISLDRKRRHKSIQEIELFLSDIPYVAQAEKTFEKTFILNDIPYEFILINQGRTRFHIFGGPHKPRVDIKKNGIVLDDEGIFNLVDEIRAMDRNANKYSGLNLT